MDQTRWPRSIGIAGQIPSDQVAKFIGIDNMSNVVTIKMLPDKIFDIKSQLRQMAKRGLLKMVFSQPEENCILGGLVRFS